MSLTPQTVESIIAADVGSAATKAVLIDLVEGEFRIIARAEFPSTLEPPWSDVSLAVRQCISRIEAIAQRRLLDKRGGLLMPERADGSGVDAFVVSASAAEPLRVAIAGLVRDTGVESVRRATHTTYALPQTLFSLESRPRDGKRWDLPARIGALHRQSPAVIILAGGEGSAAPVRDVVTAVATACETWPEAYRPDVIFAGSSATGRRVAELIGETANLRVVEHLRPSAAGENLHPIESELEAIYLERRLYRLPQIGRLAVMASKPIAATATAFGAGVRAIANHFKMSTLGVDVGSATTGMMIADGAQFHRVLRSDLGVGHSVESTARAAGIGQVLRWMPLEMAEEEAWDRLANKSIRPTTLPATRKDLFLEYAVAREAMRLTLKEILERWQPGRGLMPFRHEARMPEAGSASGKARLYPHLTPRIDLVVGAGGVLNHPPVAGLSALLLLDALQPVGAAILTLDSGGLIPQLSLIAGVQPQAAAQLAAGDGLAWLGTAICPVSTARAGEVVLTYRLTYQARTSEAVSASDGGVGAVTGEVRAGEIDVLPVAPGQKAKLELRPKRSTDVGRGRGKPAMIQADGGLVGVIIDARGRPLALPADAAKRRSLVQTWLSSVGVAPDAAAE